MVPTTVTFDNCTGIGTFDTGYTSEQSGFSGAVFGYETDFVTFRYPDSDIREQHTVAHTFGEAVNLH